MIVSVKKWKFTGDTDTHSVKTHTHTHTHTHARKIQWKAHICYLFVMILKSTQMHCWHPNNWAKGLQSGMAFSNHSADHCHQFLVKKTHTFHSRTLNTSASVLQRSTCFLCDPVLTLYIHDTTNHRSASVAETHEKVSSFCSSFSGAVAISSCFAISSSFLREALCFDADLHSSRSALFWCWLALFGFEFSRFLRRLHLASVRKLVWSSLVTQMWQPHRW